MSYARNCGGGCVQPPPETSVSVFCVSLACLHIIGSHCYCSWRVKNLLYGVSGCSSLQAWRVFPAGGSILNLHDCRCVTERAVQRVGGNSRSSGATLMKLQIPPPPHTHTSAPTWTLSHKERGFLPSGLFLLRWGNQTVEHAEGDETF